MLIKLSSRLSSSPKSYIDLFSEQMKGGYNYKLASGKEISLPENKRLNTLIVNVQTDTDSIEELVVEFLGDVLVLAGDQRKNLTPKLISQLEKLGKQTFSSNAEGNFVDNSQNITLSSNACFVQNSSNIRINNSNGSCVSDSNRVKIAESSHTKSDKTSWALIDNSSGVDIEKSFAIKIRNSKEAKVNNSGLITLWGSDKANIQESSCLRIQNSPESKVETSSSIKIVESPNSSVRYSGSVKIIDSSYTELDSCYTSRIQQSPKSTIYHSDAALIKNSSGAKVLLSNKKPFNIFLWDFNWNVQINNSPDSQVNLHCLDIIVDKSPKSSIVASTKCEVKYNEGAMIDQSKNIILMDSAKTKISNSNMVDCRGSEDSIIDNVTQTVLTNSPKVNINNIPIIKTAWQGFMESFSSWYIWGQIRKLINIVNSSNTTLTNTYSLRLKNKPNSNFIDGKGLKKDS